MARPLSDILTMSGIPDNSPFVSVHTSDTDASFLVHHLLTSHIKGGNLLCVIAMSQTMNHYNTVAQKLGINLKQFVTTGKLIFIEALKSIGDQILREDRTDDSSQQNDIFSNLLRHKTMKFVFAQLKSILEKLSHENRPIMVVIDHIEVLLDIGINFTEIVDFVHYINIYLRNLSCENAVNKLVILMENNRDDSCESEKLLKFIQHKSSHCIHVSGLKTGYCKDITGQMSITQMADPNGLPHWNSTPPTTVHYKVGDRNVTCFALGTSPAVL